MPYHDPTADLPPTWLWTRQSPEKTLYAARDTRWPPEVPDLVSTSREDVIRQAEDCNDAWEVRLPEAIAGIDNVLEDDHLKDYPA